MHRISLAALGVGIIIGLICLSATGSWVFGVIGAVVSGIIIAKLDS